MTSRDPQQPFPNGVAIAAGFLVVVAILASGIARWTDLGTVRLPRQHAISSVQLAFEDRADGSVAIVDFESARDRRVLAMGEGGFIRSAVRGLARERTRRGLGSDSPFELVRWSDGRISLVDPETGRSIEVDAFGPDNARPFRELLESAG
ncbi:MAG: photosynthetic complex assembly protein PuhC [Myxococcota bacterium]